MEGVTSSLTINRKENIFKGKEAYFMSYTDVPEEVKNKARETVRVAVRNGQLVRPEKCPRCEHVDNIVGHHWDYTYPLIVEWMCSACHTILHHGGKPLTAEHKRKLSEALKGRPFTEEHIQNMIGKIRSEECCQAISDRLKGIPKSEEHRQHLRGPKSEEHRKHLSEAHKGLQAGEKNPFYGKHHTEETLEKIRGPKSEEHRQKMKEAWKLRRLRPKEVRSPEACQRMKEAWKLRKTKNTSV
jgi:hypothetical protein